MVSRAHFFAQTQCCDCGGEGGLPRHRVRIDTRVYVTGFATTRTVQQSWGTCVGTVWTARPLTADPGPRNWGPIEPDDDLKIVLELYSRAYRSAFYGKPRSHDYIQVIYLSHVPADERFAQVAAPETCKCQEEMPKTISFILAAWGFGAHASSADRAKQAIQRHLGRENITLPEEMLFFIQPDPPPTPREYIFYARRPLAARLLEELRTPAALGDAVFRENFENLARSLPAYPVSGSDGDVDCWLEP